jgi:iron complex transport system ATP-binding protein
MSLITKNLELAYPERLVVPNLNFELPIGKITSLIGANGSGKSTILRALARLLKPRAGDVLLDGKAIQNYASKEVAKRLAILPQNQIAPEGLTVTELLQFGRYPHQQFLQNNTQDQTMIENALRATNLLELRDSTLEILSGGQRQRAWIAMALAQNTPFLLLDEPTTHLDVHHQLEILELLSYLNSSQSKTILMVLHDLNQASRYSHEIVTIKNGMVYNQGTPTQVLTPTTLREVFQLETQIIANPVNGAPHIIPIKISSSAVP